ncbi:MAG: phenylacetate--CoA ligase family protein [Deltaproteobacteria bacterium]|nr:phenylacetate--CoA ligase family protein [Deltaproteobacteria bacterium]
MNALDLALVLWKRRALRPRERWPRARLDAHRARALAALRAFARARSPFYRSAWEGLEGAPLEALPVVTKGTLNERFDEMLTDRTLRLAALRGHLGRSAEALFAGRYHVAATSGSSGVQAVVPTTRGEFTTVIASYGRASEWTGLRLGPGRRTRLAVVSSLAPYHQSLQVGRAVESPFVETARFDAGQPLGEILAGLQRFQPEVLVAYASVVRMLAEEQLAGRLGIRPRAVNSASEVLTAEARARATEAWGVAPFEVYAATETGGIAAECERHAGMHLFEDLVITEVVDAQYRPVPEGSTGERLLVTVLFSRTLPLVRYELTDRVRAATRACACGRTFRLLEAVEGRADDVLVLPAPDGRPVRVHPVVFEGALDLLHARAWQVRQTARGLEVRVAAPSVDAEVVRGRLAEALRRAGAAPVVVDVTAVPELPAAASGKRPLVVALRPAP